VARLLPARREPKNRARQVVRDHGGKLPREYSQLRTLAGIGDYTAGAILSIAFGKNYSRIDGNVRRVLGASTRSPTTPALRDVAIELVRRTQPREFNQALNGIGPLTSVRARAKLRRLPARK